MKSYIYTALFCLLTCMLYGEEFQLALKLPYTSFVKGETVVAQLELLNVGRELVKSGFSQGDDRFFVEICFGDRYNSLKPIDPAPFSKPFTLNPGSKHVCRIQMDKWFNLLKEGTYYANLVYLHNGIRYESTRKSFDIVPGIPVKEGVQMFVSAQKLRRVFRLVHWNRNQSERLFLRIEDEPGGAVWDSIDLGPHLKSSEPKLDIAENGEVTVVHRATQDAFHRILVWSLHESVEIAERNTLLDPEVTASQRMRSLYGDMVEEGPVNPVEKKWWEFWK